MPVELDVLDNFDRSNSTTTLGSSWSLATDYTLGGTDLGISSNQAYKGSGTGYVVMYWNAASFAREQGVRLTVSTKPSDAVAIFTRIANPGTGTTDAYDLTIQTGTPDTWKINRNDDDVSTQLGATASQTLTAGDKIQLESDGSTHTGWLYTGGSWSAIISRSDSTYLVGGYTGFYGTGSDSTWRYDDFAAGVLFRPIPNIALKRGTGGAGAGPYELWLTTDAGERIQNLDSFITLTATRVVNEIGQFTLQLPPSFDESLIKEDRMVQIWRRPTGGRLGLWRVYFVRDWRFRFTPQGETLEIMGPDCNDLLRRRIVAAYSGSSEAKKTATAADNMMKDVVSESQLDTADPTPTAGTRTWTDFSVAGDLSDGPSIDQSFPFDSLLTESGNGALAQIANSARGAGTEVFFDIVPDTVSSSSISFIFRTYTGQPGQDVSDRVVFSPQNGNMKEATLEYICSKEENYIYSGGQGEQADRNVQQAYDAARYSASKWNRCEGFISDTRQSTDDSVSAAGDGRLAERAYKIRFSGIPMDTRGTRFGRDWDFGYKVTAKYRNYQQVHIIRAVTLYKPRNGPEEVRCRLDYES